MNAQRMAAVEVASRVEIEGVVVIESEAG